MRVSIVSGVTYLALILAVPATAATSYTNLQNNFQVSYPSDWSVAARSTDTAFSPGRTASLQLRNKGITYRSIVRWLSGSRSWSPADRFALQKGWSSFVAQYIQDFKTEHSVSSVTQKRYTLAGFTARQVIFRKKLSPNDTAETQWRVILLSTNRTSVYAILSQWSWPRGMAATEPYQKEFQALVQSFRRLSPLPSLASFQTHPTDQFLVDMDVVATGNPFKGFRSLQPHAGAHIHFGDDYLTWPRGGTAPSNYPPIYAVADGIIDSVDYSLHVSPNDRYGVALAIAKEGAATWYLDYSIEPMVPEPSPNFYRPFLSVKKGDAVEKGQVIGYMYLPVAANGTHIHFHLRKTGHEGFYAPAIFTPTIVQAFHDRWGEFGVDGGQEAIPGCMGWKLGVDENPFAREAVNCLK